MRYLVVLMALGMSFGLLGCDEGNQQKVDEATEKLERAAESLKRVGKRAQQVAADVVLPPAQEEQLGDRMARQIRAESELVEGKPVSEYVEELGQRVVSAAEDRPEAIGFEFHVLRDGEINAFAIPGGHIYVTTGLLEAAETEAELVAVLAHEVAHVTQRHIAERMTAAYGVSMLTRLALGEESGALEQIAVEVLARGYLLKHSRDDEREADKKGMRYVIEAGYAPVGYVDFFDRLAEQPQPPALLSTHPNPEERAQAARRALDKLDQEIVERPVHRERYQSATRGL